MDGWIKLHRKITDTEMWTAEPFTKGQAWVDLLLSADYTSGELETTIADLSKRWKWTWHKAARFIKDLENAEMISASNAASNRRPNARPTKIHIIKWKDYQAKNDPRPMPRPTDVQTRVQPSANLPFYKNKEIYKEEKKNAHAREAAGGKEDIFRYLDDRIAEEAEKEKKQA